MGQLRESGLEDGTGEQEACPCGVRRRSRCLEVCGDGLSLCQSGAFRARGGIWPTGRATAIEVASSDSTSVKKQMRPNKTFARTFDILTGKTLAALVSSFSGTRP